MTIKSFRAALLLLLTTSLTSFAENGASASPRVWSRSIMDSCDYVYRVESDLRLQLPAGLMEIYDPELLHWAVSFSNSWDREPRFSTSYEWTPDAKGLVALTLETMSTSGGYLFRDMYFRVMIRGEDGESVSLTPVYHADIGRRFGELCAPSRASNPPFLEREVNEVPRNDEPQAQNDGKALGNQ